MKRFNILITAVVFAFFMAVTVIAAGEDEPGWRSRRADAGQERRDNQEQMREKELEAEQIHEQQGDGEPAGHKGSYLPTDANGIEDANSVMDRAKKYPDLMADLEHIEKGMMNEARQWERGEADDRIEITEVVMKQIMDELMLIRKYAKEEKAEKTITAIDNILIRRDENLTQIRDDAREEKREKTREERGLRPRGFLRSRGMEMDNRVPGEDGRPRFRTKQRNVEEQQEGQKQEPWQNEQPEQRQE